MASTKQIEEQLEKVGVSGSQNTGTASQTAQTLPGVPPTAAQGGNLQAAGTEDPRLTAVQNNQQQAMQDIENTYGGMAEGVKQNLQQQQAMTQDWVNKQTELQQQQTDFTIEQIEQQKEQAQKDMAKEQGAAYTDYQKQTAKHGVNAEQMAAQGMSGTGYSESGRVAMYTAYQNRVAVARESAEKAMVSFNNAITQARMQNSSVLAQIAFDGLKTQLELGLQGMQYENQLLTEMLGLKLNTQNMYHGQYMDILNQINQEKAFDESVRQYEQSYRYQQERDKTADQQWREQFEYGKSQDEIARQQWEKQFQYGQERDQTADQQWREQFEYGKSQDKQAQANWDKQFEYGQERDKTADQQWREQFEYGKTQDKQAQANWDKQYALSVEEQAWNKKAQSASLMASAGDFSGYKNLLGLTDAQVKKLQSEYQKGVKTEEDEAAYNKKLQKASLLASGGDFSGYKDLFGLTNAQVKKLEAAYSKDSGGLIIDPAGDPGGTSLPAQGNANTKAAKLAILDEKDFKKYQGSGRVKVNGKNYTNYQAYAMARIEDIANNGLNGKQLTDEEIEWLLAEYGLLK